MARYTIRFLALSLMLALSQATSMAESPEQIYEVRTYVLGDNGDADAIDQYLKDALIPALNRQGIKSVGALTNASNDESGKARIVVIIPFASANQVTESHHKLHADEAYQKAAADYLSAGPKDSPYQRISSELLTAMDCWPELKVASGSLENQDRVYELRVYESPNERLGHLKVDMFNNGEVPIFLAAKIQPVFIGQGLIGPQSPNLTYLTMFASDEAREQAWVDFRKHPDWQVLKEVEKYKGTVSKNDKCIMVAKPYSQM